jgi:HD-GYP domain-containing protein (c-di-GMP phosphodiesterase class II)
VSASLPDNLFTHHRLVEDGEFIFRLSDKYRATLLAGNDAPLPAALPDESLPPLQATLSLAHHLMGVFGHFVRLDDSDTLLKTLIMRIAKLAKRTPDGCIASILLSPYEFYAPHHAINCAMLAALTANSLQLPADEHNILIGAALTMNLGSADIQNQMAHQDSPPSTLQRQILDIHPLLSSAMLREISIEDQEWHSAIMMHHERRDGKGYTFGIKGDEIPPFAQLLHLLDVVTAKLMPRSYRSRVPPKQALASLYSGENEEFNPDFVAQLVKILGIYPPGSCVALQNGERALVIKNGKTAATPLAVLIKNPGQSIDTSETGYHIDHSVNLHVEARHLHLFHQYWS